MKSLRKSRLRLSGGPYHSRLTIRLTSRFMASLLVLSTQSNSHIILIVNRFATFIVISSNIWLPFDSMFWSPKLYFNYSFRSFDFHWVWYRNVWLKCISDLYKTLSISSTEVLTSADQWLTNGPVLESERYICHTVIYCYIYGYSIFCVLYVCCESSYI